MARRQHSCARDAVRVDRELGRRQMKDASREVHKKNLLPGVIDSQSSFAVTSRDVLSRFRVNDQRMGLGAHVHAVMCTLEGRLPGG